MKPDLNMLREITQGAVKISNETDKFRFYRFTDNELGVVENANLEYPAGVQLVFKTDGDKLKMRGNTWNVMKIRSFYAFDVFVDGKRVGSIQNFKDKNCVGNYSEKEYPMGVFDGEFDLGKGEKSVRIVLPYSLAAEFENIEIENATYIRAEKRRGRLIMYGDSITQGYDAAHPSDTYAMRLAEFMGLELINKGLGGAVFCPEMVKAADDTMAECVVVAYGTNDWNNSDAVTFRKKADEFVSAVRCKYPDVPVFVISPIWRWDYAEKKEFGEFFTVRDIIGEACEKHENVYMIDGFNLVPPREELFGDTRLHPSGKGFSEYFKNLTVAMKEIKGDVFRNE